MGVPCHLVTIRGQMVLKAFASIVLFKFWHFEVGRYDQVRTKHSSLGSTLLRLSIPSITFSFLSRRLHLCCKLMYSDCPDRFFLNFSCLQRSFGFGTVNWLSLFFQDASLSRELGSSVIPFPFIKIVIIFVTWESFSYMPCRPFSISSILMVLSFSMLDWWSSVPFWPYDSKSFKMFKLQQVRINRGDFLIKLLILQTKFSWCPLTK